MNEATPCSMPPVIGYKELAVLLGRSTKTLQADKCRKPWSIPPHCAIPGSKEPRWLLADVLSWIEGFRQKPQEVPEEPDLPPPPKRRGRPTKREQMLKRKAMGLAV